jgi:DNA-directed RNA polymerase subunit RPC12/RpoP
MCPSCDGGDFDAVYICDDCGTVFEDDDMLDDNGRCEDCTLTEEE